MDPLRDILILNRVADPVTDLIIWKRKKNPVPTLRKHQVIPLELDGNSEHVEHALRKIGRMKKCLIILDMIKCL